ncbi:hypothetical protein [Streptomyces geranii]|uniref:hypothetical protein n=1 Tax=Streptomyces geranii TaxID=2058923 RepID=UPI001300A563|nr:hypothetical protein [Streptomyces geranii]
MTVGPTLPYRTGTVEGHVNRVMFLKRQSNGRADSDLLRRRILLTPRTVTPGDPEMLIRTAYEGHRQQGVNLAWWRSRHNGFSAAMSSAITSAARPVIRRLLMTSA